MMQKLYSVSIWCSGSCAGYSKTCQKVMIIVMPMMPLANVAHLYRVSGCKDSHSQRY